MMLGSLFVDKIGLVVIAITPRNDFEFGYAYLFVFDFLVDEGIGEAGPGEMFSYSV
jgi:hypothetical protein